MVYRTRESLNTKHKRSFRPLLVSEYDYGYVNRVKIEDIFAHYREIIRIFIAFRVRTVRKGSSTHDCCEEGCQRVMNVDDRENLLHRDFGS